MPVYPGAFAASFYEGAGVKSKLSFFLSSLVCAHLGRLAPEPCFLLRACLSASALLEGTLFVALPTGGFSGGPTARYGDAGDDLLSVSACSGRCT
jgi:hypothetical protein